MVLPKASLLNVLSKTYSGLSSYVLQKQQQQQQQHKAYVQRYDLACYSVDMASLEVQQG
jgi:N-dimethylarginine dimethylaminohydrolase